MALSAFLEIPGVKGSAIQKGREGLITVNGVVHDVQSEWHLWSKKEVPHLEMNKSLSPTKAQYVTPFDNWEVKPTIGAHKPLVITKGLDVASPILHNHMVLPPRGYTIWPQISLYFWRNPPFGGQEENYFTIKFRNAFVMGIKLVMQNNRVIGNEMLPEQEEVSFGYTEVYYEYKASGGGPAKAESASSNNLDVYIDFPKQDRSNVFLQAVAQRTAANAIKGVGGIMYDLAGKKQPAPPADPPAE